MSAVPDDRTGAAVETRAEKVNRLVEKHAKKAADNVITQNNYSGGKNSAIIAASMYALAVDLGLVEIEEEEETG